MPSREDRRAAKALVKLGLLDEEEVEEILEAVDEIEPEGGILGLLEEEGHLSAEDLGRVRAALEKGSRPGPRRADRTRVRGGKTRARRRESDREEAPAGTGGKGKVLVFGVLGLVAVGAVVVAAVMLGGGGSGSDGGPGENGETSAGADDAGEASGSGTADASTSGGDASGSAGSGTTEPAVPALTLRYRFRQGLRIIYQSEMEAVDRSKAKKLVTKKGVTEYTSCMGETEAGRQKVCLERSVTVTRIREGKPPERSDPSNRFDFLVLTPEGRAISEGVMGAEDLLLVMADVIFPEGGRIEGGEWHLEREAKEGRFDVRYRIESTAETLDMYGAEDKRLVRIGVEAGFPGGAPPSTFRLDRAGGTIWFDPEDGVVMKSEVFLDTSPATAEREAEPEVTRTLKRTLFDRGEIAADELEEIKAAADIYFGVLSMVNERQFVKAQKTVETADLSRKYCPILPDLKGVIPEVRMAQQARGSMREREPWDLRSLPWRRPDRPPAMLLPSTPKSPGKRRPLEHLKGKRAPEWLKKHCADDKATLVYFVMSPFECCWSTAKLAAKFVKENASKLQAKGVLLETEGRKMWEFMARAGFRLNHKLVLDKEMKSVTEGNLPGVPAIFVVDRGGSILYAEVGFFHEVTEKELGEVIDKLH